MHVPNVGKRPHNSFDPILASGNRVENKVSHGRGVTLPRIRAGEASKGYLGRLAATNSCVSLATLLTQLKHLSPCSDAAIENIGMNTVMAALTDVEAGAFLARHTLLPFQKCVVPPQSWSPFRLLTAQRARAAYNFPANIPGALMFLCHVCVASEIEATGDSIWHRSHQLPGVVICSKHKVGLHSVATASLLKYPHQILSDAETINEAIVEDALANAFICRYMHLCELFAARTEPYTTLQLTTIICQRVSKIDPGSSNKPVRLTRYIQRYLNSPWVSEFFPQLQRVRGASNLSSFDQAGTRIDLAYPTPYYCLALAVLFDSVAEVAQALTAATANPAPLTIIKQNAKKQSSGRAENDCIQPINGPQRTAGVAPYDAITAALQDFSNGNSIDMAAEKNNVTSSEVVERLRWILLSQM
jgi:hypothetical protein